MPENNKEDLKKKPVFILFPETLDDIKKGICPTGGKNFIQIYFEELLDSRDLNS